MDPTQALLINEDLKNTIFSTGQVCDTTVGKVGEGIAVGVEGTTKASAWFGFSMVATWDPPGTVQVHEAGGFFRAQGYTDATFKVGGTGILDTSQKFSGGAIQKLLGKTGLKGHSIYHGW